MGWESILKKQDPIKMLAEGIYEGSISVQAANDMFFEIMQDLEKRGGAAAKHIHSEEFRELWQEVNWYDGSPSEEFREKEQMSDEDFLEEVTQDSAEGRFILGAYGEIEHRRAKKLLGQEDPKREVNEQTRYDELREQQENARD
jgi:hypothetical protein